MNTAETVMARRLARMRWIATGLLAAMAVLFVVSSLLLDAHPWLGLIQAFAEAGMIGALADWFAVTALFRHPLGLPVPHTAIVPTRKDEIGRVLADFIRDHFLVRETVAARLERVDLAARVGTWLAAGDHARSLGRDLSVALVWLLEATDSTQLRAALRETLRGALDRAPLTSGLEVVLDVLSSGKHSQALVNQLVRFGREQLEHNKDRIRERIADRSPWWLPKFVDREIYDQLVTELQRILDEIGDDPDHPARAHFNARLGEVRTALSEDPAFMERGQALKDEFLDHPAVRHYFHELWLKIRESLVTSLRDPQSVSRLAIAGELQAIGHELRDNGDVNRRVNRWLRELILYLVDTYREPLSAFISETIEQWDPAATSARIELYIGRDLQFIRINGTLVGGLVGVAIYLVWGLFG